MNTNPADPVDVSTMRCADSGVGVLLIRHSKDIADMIASRGEGLIIIASDEYPVAVSHSCTHAVEALKAHTQPPPVPIPDEDYFLPNNRHTRRHGWREPVQWPVPPRFLVTDRRCRKPKRR